MISRFDIQQEAQNLGFDAIGVARCRPLEEQRARLCAWLSSERAAGLGYMQRHLEKRLNPALLFEGAKSIVVCAMSYNRQPPPEQIPRRIASYALGLDYHIFMRKRLEELLTRIETHFPGATGRVFVDSAPILEKAWAVEAGLGWIGRNGVLIHPRLGSFLTLGVIVSTAEISANTPFSEEKCGSCRACIAACPANAIGEDRMINASVCISRRTIEKATEAEGDLQGWLFGCDTCQRVCPHNHRAPQMAHPEFAPLAALLALDREGWLSLSEEEFQARFSQSPLARCGLERFKRRIAE